MGPVTNLLLFYAHHASMGPATNLLLFYTHHASMGPVTNLLTFYTQHASTRPVTNLLTLYKHHASARPVSKPTSLNTQHATMLALGQSIFALITNHKAPGKAANRAHGEWRLDLPNKRRIPYHYVTREVSWTLYWISKKTPNNPETKTKHCKLHTQKEMMHIPACKKHLSNISAKRQSESPVKGFQT